MPQSRPTANPRYQEEEKKEIFFLLLFSAYKNVKSFYTGKIAKKKCVLFMACTPVYSIVYGICGTSLQFIQNSNPTLQGPTTPKRDR